MIIYIATGGCREANIKICWRRCVQIQYGIGNRIVRVLNIDVIGKIVQDCFCSIAMLYFYGNIVLRHHATFLLGRNVNKHFTVVRI